MYDPETVEKMTSSNLVSVASTGILQKLRKIPLFYIDGFRGMTVGRTLWTIIAVKLVVMFGILKIFFFPDFLATNFDNDAERSAYVLEQITAQHVTPDPNAEGESQ